MNDSESDTQAYLVIIRRLKSINMMLMDSFSHVLVPQPLRSSYDPQLCAK
jgi:hypothetical protein